MARTKIKNGVRVPLSSAEEEARDIKEADENRRISLHESYRAWLEGCPKASTMAWECCKELARLDSVFHNLGINLSPEFLQFVTDTQDHLASSPPMTDPDVLEEGRNLLP